jgi:hypothetical protein
MNFHSVRETICYIKSSIGKKINKFLFYLSFRLNFEREQKRRMALADDLNFIQHIFTRYILPICFLLGIIGNLLNISVFCQKHLRRNSCSIYFISTSIFNFLVMFFGIIPIVYTSYSSYDYASYSVIYCKFRSYIVHVLLMMSRSSVALACIDRFALCSSNVHIRALNQHHIAIRLVCAISFLWLLIPTHMIIEVDIEMPGRRCGAEGIYLIIYSIYAAIVTAIPLIIMIIFSTLAIRSLRHVRARVHPNIHSTVRIRKRDVQFVLILISEVIIYLLSTVLFPVYSIYIAVTSATTKDPDRLAIEGFIRYLTLSFLIYVNSCSIFYVHLLASKAFRQECKQLILCLYKQKRNNHFLLTQSRISNVRKQLEQVD